MVDTDGEKELAVERDLFLECERPKGIMWGILEAKDRDEDLEGGTKSRTNTEESN